MAIDTDLVRIRRCLEDDGLDPGLSGPDGGEAHNEDFAIVSNSPSSCMQMHFRLRRPRTDSNAINDNNLREARRTTGMSHE